MWNLKESGGITFFEFDAGPRFSVLFTTRIGGASARPYDSLNFGPAVQSGPPAAGDRREAVDENFARLGRALTFERPVTLSQIHSNRVLYARAAMTGAGDGLFTDRPGLALAVKVADCLPIYVYGSAVPTATAAGVQPIASTASVAAIAHAGWRGTAKQIAAVLVRSISKKCNTPCRNLSYAFGPCIGPCCYDVGSDVREIFNGKFIAVREGKFYLDLKAANRTVLNDMGLTEAGSLDLCTRCNPDLFYSARRDTPTGRNLALIRINP